MNEVTKPKHYTQGSIECVDAIAAMIGKDRMQDFYRSQVVKYIWRMMDKGDPLKDAMKAEWFIKQLITSLSKNPRR